MQGESRVTLWRRPGHVKTEVLAALVPWHLQLQTGSTRDGQTCQQGNEEHLPGFMSLISRRAERHLSPQTSLAVCQ